MVVAFRVGSLFCYFLLGCRADCISQRNQYHTFFTFRFFGAANQSTINTIAIDQEESVVLFEGPDSMKQQNTLLQAI